MKYRLTRNLGKTTCVGLGLASNDSFDPTAFTEGTLFDVDGKTAEALLKQGLIEQAEKIKAVPKETITAPSK